MQLMVKAIILDDRAERYSQENTLVEFLEHQYRTRKEAAFAVLLVANIRAQTTPPYVPFPERRSDLPFVGAFLLSIPIVKIFNHAQQLLHKYPIWQLLMQHY